MAMMIPGQSKVWVRRHDGSTWYALPHTVSWNIASSIEEATEIRTSDTNNQKVAACGGATSWEATFTSALCEDDWLYAYILTDESNPTSGNDLWFYCDHGSSDQLHPENAGLNTLAESGPVASLDSMLGVLFRGTVQAPGFEMDNDASDPTVVEWTAKITNGPYFPMTDPDDVISPTPLIGLPV